MREELTKLYAALQSLKKASVFRKAIAAEVAIESAVVLLEKMVGEIEKLKRDKEDAETTKV